MFFRKGNDFSTLRFFPLCNVIDKMLLRGFSCFLWLNVGKIGNEKGQEFIGEMDGHPILQGEVLWHGFVNA